MTDLAPNPCLTEIEQSEEFIPHTFDAATGTCTPQSIDLRTRAAPAIRFQNPVMTTHLVDVETRGDDACRADLMGAHPPFSAVYQGYQIGFELMGGFIPMFVPPIDAAFPVTLEAAPNGRLWVLDQGNPSSTIRGRVFVINPGMPLDGFQVATIL